jgi:hypothetical protein
MATTVPARDAKRAEQAADRATRERKETERLTHQAREDRVATEEIARDVAAATQESPSSPGPFVVAPAPRAATPEELTLEQWHGAARGTRSRRRGDNRPTACLIYADLRNLMSNMG